MYCPSCGAQNESGFRFCIKCGTQLESTTTAVTTEPVIENRPSYPEQSLTPAVPPPNTVAQPQFQNQTAQPYARQEGIQSRPGQILTQDLAAMSVIGIWSPFAGYGTRRRHTGWLMDNQVNLAQNLSDKITQKFNERTIPGAVVEKKNLTGRGVIVETRPYFLVRQGLVTIGLYVAQIGKDLFVSLASYLKPPISNVRLSLVILMALFALYTLFIFPNSLASAVENLLGGFMGFGGRTSSGGNLGTLLCIVGPLGTLNLLSLSLFVVYSLYKFMTEKDILAGLRVTPNEFNEDDLMAVEKAVEQTVRISLDEIGVNADDLIPIAVEGGRRLI
jgi:hypothetical protein